ncbi:hypothetical protein GCM10028791_18590 [Echinicola sediminis]
MKKTLGFFLAALVLFASCSKNEEPMAQQSEKPVMPPESSMAPDMSLFDDQESSGSREIAVSNWAYAALNVGVYSAILHSHLAVPVRAFKATVNTDAQFNADAGLWVWEKAFQVPSKGSFDVRLTAEVNGTDVSWTGYVSGEGYDKYVWFTGTSKLNGEMGAWELYDGNKGNPQVWLSNSWEFDKESGKATTTFTVEKEGESKGSSISYTVDNSMDLNRSVVINNVQLSNEISVDWSKEDKYGRVKSQSHFENALYHCWDASLQNSFCE